jgi:hypothetical protein
MKINRSGYGVSSVTFDYGNVGIGTASPDSRLVVQVGGTNNTVRTGLILRTPESDIGTGYNIDFYQSTALVGRIASLTESGGAIGMAFSTYNGSTTERMRIDNSGNVGIGTASPGQALHVYRSGVASRVKIEAPSTQETEVQLYHTGDAAAWSMYMPGSSDSLRFYRNGDKMTLTSDGNVGIGTTSPLSLLTIRTNYYGGESSGLCLDSNDGSVYNFRLYSFVQSVGNVGWKFRVNNGASSVDALTLGSTGNVGIGTASPTARLTLWCDHSTPSDGSSTAAAKPEIGLVWRNRLVTSAGGSPNPDWYAGSSRDSASIWYQPRSYSSVSSGALGVHGSINFNCNWTGTETTRMTITSLGRVGIGVTTPAYSLDVNGNFRAYGVIDSSDRRIKKNIVDVNDTSALETIRLLKPKKYDYRDTESRTHETVWGFIAQDVREVLPYATDVISDYIPNVMEYANVSSSNVLTFDTSVLESNVVSLRLKDIHGDIHDVTIDEIIDGNTIRVIEDLDAWTGSFDAEGNVITATTTTTITVEEYEALEDTTDYKSTADGYTKTTITYPGSQIFVYGQKVDDFHTLNKNAIWTIATAALQEVDRQLQAEKAKVATLETQLASVLARLDALESA